MAHNYQKKEITDDVLQVVSFFISSNTSLLQLDNPALRTCFKLKLPCSDTFVTTYLPFVLDRVYAEIGELLVNSESVCLISDIWTNKQMLDFMGLVACTIDSFFQRQFIVIGMCLMPGNHCAENIKKAVEVLVNRYDFDYSKIIGSTTFTSSNNLFKFKNRKNLIYSKAFHRMKEVHTCACSGNLTKETLFTLWTKQTLQTTLSLTCSQKMMNEPSSIMM